MLSSTRLAGLLAVFFLGGCSLFQPADRFGATPVSFADLSGWPEEDHVAALAAFLTSCPVVESKSRPANSGSGLNVSVTVWQSLCAQARQTLATPLTARAFFEQRFTPYRINNNGREEGLFTGYYEPVLYGALHRYGDFQYPLYKMPPNDFAYTHAEINNGRLNGRNLELLWVDDPVMRFFLHIQGSGRVKLTDGRELFIGFAGKNGQPYRPIGKIAGDEGLIPKGEINFFSLRQWLYLHPDQAFALMEKNPSYVFFTRRDKEGAIGALGVALTPERSMAVDSAYIPYGLPVWLETVLPAEPQRDPLPFKRLLMAQDTGGAIKGPVRGDIFFGTGQEAEYRAGYMAARGTYTLLAPNEITEQLQTR